LEAKNTITFINHASIHISGNDYGLLCDPWYFGSIFHNGWSLLYENPKSSILEVIEKTNYIWISHEHPDHFSIEFFRNYKNIIKDRKITVIFQNTKDHRVTNFIRSCGINIIELSDGEIFKIEENFTLEIEKNDFYDSLAIIRVNGVNIFNLNDCPIKTKSKIAKLKAKHGRCDVLLTQFSYAAWKGGRSRIDLRRESAEKKIETMNLQAQILEAKILIPFASFVRFSNDLNKYLNKEANSASKLAKHYLDNPLFATKVLILSPMQKLMLNDIYSCENNLSGAIFWEEIALKNKNIHFYIDSFDQDIFSLAFYNYIKRLKNNNNFYLIQILSRLPFLKLFSRVDFLLIDVEIIVSIDIPNERICFGKTDHWDISLHSESLLFILKYQYGFDTLTINGCFEASSHKAFNKFCKAFALENMNNIGYSINLCSLFSLDFLKLVLLFFSKLRLKWQ